MPNERDRLIGLVLGAILTLSIGGLVAKVRQLDDSVSNLRVDMAVIQNEVRHANATLSRIEVAIEERTP